MAVPSLNDFATWIKTEASYALTTVLVIFAVRFFFKQQIGRLIALFVLAGIVFFAIASPEVIMKGIQEIFKKVVK